jgi:Fe-S cluster assembly protein SufD
MNTPVQRSAAETAYTDAFDAAESVLPRAEWFQPVRSAARQHVTASGLPHRRMESWRWTDLRTLIDGEFPPRLEIGEATASPALGNAFGACERHLAVFVDGRFEPSLSKLEGLDAGIELHHLGAGMEEAPDWLRGLLGNGYGGEDDTVKALNSSFFVDGIALRIGAGVKPSQPLELKFYNSGNMPQTIFTRIAILVDAEAEFTLLESHEGSSEGHYVANSVVELHVEDGGRLDHVKLQNESRTAVHLANIHASVGAAATYRNFILHAGSRVTRQQIFSKLAGEGGDLDVSGAYLLADNQHCDTALLVDHAVPGCTSNELFKCVMDDAARGVFQGKIVVRPDAQQTDGMQMSQALLLSERAEFNAKPELAIFADDVRCTHGATSGDLDEDLMFYLRSRGIPTSEAKALLIAAFVGSAVEQVAREDVRDALNEAAVGWLER